MVDIGSMSVKALLHFRDAIVQAGMQLCRQAYIAYLTLRTMQAEKAGQEGEQQLQLHAFEAINDLVRSAAGDTLPVVAQLLPLALQKLTASFQPTAERAGDIQVILCASLCEGLLAGLHREHAVPRSACREAAAQPQAGAVGTVLHLRTHG